MMEALLLSTEEMAKRLSLSRSSFYSLHSSGRLGPKPVRLNRRSLWSLQEFEAWIAHDCPSREIWQKMRSTDKQSVAR